MPCHSVPTSPAMTRSTSLKSQPVTPQRLHSQRPQHRYSSSQSLYRSPITPVSPYTPLSLRSFISSGSGDSSTLTTPDYTGINVKHLLLPPEVAKSATRAVGKDHSLADIADNWRSRATENGIRVSSTNDESHYGDDEASERTFSDTANDSAYVSTEEALLAPPFIASQKRPEFLAAIRPRAQSHAPRPTSHFSSPLVSRHAARIPHPTSPLVARRLNQSQNSNVTSTPPQNKALARQLKLKGSFTDPAHTRRREAFGTLRTPSQNNNKSFNLCLNQDTSLDLFDIDENEYEYDYDYNYDQAEGDDSLMELSFGSNNSMTNNNNNAYGYQNYAAPLISSRQHQQQYFPSHSLTPFADPFQGHALSSITESVEHYFHTQQFGDPGGYAGQGNRPVQLPNAPPGVAPIRPGAYGVYAGTPAWVPVPTPSPITSLGTAGTSGDRKGSKSVTLSINIADVAKRTPSTGCSVCLAARPSTLAVLAPCNHPLCSACLTSALNIVGEKDMECAVCRGKVDDFRLIVGDGASQATGASKDNEKHENRKGSRDWEVGDIDQELGKSFMDPLFSSPGSGVGVDGLEHAFEFGLGLANVRASTPKLHDEYKENGINIEKATAEAKNQVSTVRGRGKEKSEENIVLRIDNVPWDITPPQIRKWLQQPLERVHVLLDKKGKTMSHAYVEVSDIAVAGKILRGEAVDVDGNILGSRRVGKPRERGSVLGKGRRARGVTITRSGQEDLMADLFPNWRGSFDGARPSLARLDNGRMIGALESGLIGESEIISILHLIKEPDSHFLKAPSLPFHSLISILSKFPVDVDSRVFWTSGVRDMLYDVTYAAVQVLLSRIDTNEKPSSSNFEDGEYTMELVSELVETALNCQAFTTQQLSKFMELPGSQSRPPSTVAEICFGSGSSARSATSEPRTPENPNLSGCISAVVLEEEIQRSNVTPGSDGGGGEALAELAREFGVEAQLVQALAQRLAGLP